LIGFKEDSPIFGLRVGIMAIAFVCITTEPASMVEMLKEVRAVDGVEEAEMVYGVYDIVAKLKGETMDKLKYIITEHIRRINKVRINLTMMVIESK
jgi:DNA-binding Lrp family transcriptional regulator